MARQFRVISVSPRMNDLLKQEWSEYNKQRSKCREKPVSFIEFTSVFAGGLFYGKEKKEKEVNNRKSPLIRF